jgi:translation initiation factor 1 (eIF-1/SUI1)
MLATKMFPDMLVKMTASDFGGFQTAVSNLSTDDVNRTQLLSELKLAIGALPSAQQKSIVPSLHLENIFDCLNSCET